jgi:feruloyl-CoA synthase
MPEPRILPCNTVVEWRGDVLYARSPHRLPAYAARLTDRLEHWAAQAPGRAFLCRRDAGGSWVRLTYGSALVRVRSIAAALIDRGLSSDRPVVILSGNSIEHALLALAATYIGVPYAPIAPSYSLLAREYTTLGKIFDAMRPGLVFADDFDRFRPALESVCTTGVEVVSSSPSDAKRATPFGALERVAPGGAVDTAHASVGAETVAKILYTSGSTGAPKGVINTQRMLCANQEMIRTALPLMVEEPPILCDWLPWNHTFGGNHNFGIVLYNGGTLYMDDGKPTPDGFQTTLANLREIATTAYFNVPRGYDLLVPMLRADAAFRTHFFSRVKLLFCAAAALRQEIADALERAALDTRGERVPFVTGLGATESAPFALCAGDSAFTGGRIGVPVPGVELKLAPVSGKFEGRLRGPNITPGYWREPELTQAAFDEEGFYRLGDALGFVDPEDPSKGFVFEGRLSEDFKLSTGTWVRVGPLRAALLTHLGDLVFDVVIGGHDRDYVVALIFPNRARCEGLPAADLQQLVCRSLADFAASHPGTSTAVRRAAILDDPPAIDRQELTEKGSVNQKAVLRSRAAVVARLFAERLDRSLIEIGEGRQRDNAAP